MCAVLSPKKGTNEFFFLPWRVKKQKKPTNSFVHFLGESTARQSAYGFIWPLAIRSTYIIVNLLWQSIPFYKGLFWISNWFRTILCIQNGLNTFQTGTRQGNNSKYVVIFWLSWGNIETVWYRTTCTSYLSFTEVFAFKVFHSAENW